MKKSELIKKLEEIQGDFEIIDAERTIVSRIEKVKGDYDRISLEFCETSKNGNCKFHISCDKCEYNKTFEVIQIY